MLVATSRPILAPVGACKSEGGQRLPNKWEENLKSEMWVQISIPFKLLFTVYNYEAHGREKIGVKCHFSDNNSLKSKLLLRALHNDVS